MVLAAFRQGGRAVAIRSSLIGPIVARLRQHPTIVFFLSYHHLVRPSEMKITIKTLQQKVFQVFLLQITPPISRSTPNPD